MKHFLFLAGVAIICYVLFYVFTSLSEMAKRKKRKGYQILSAVLLGIGCIFIVLCAVLVFLVVMCILLVVIYAFISYLITGGIFGIIILVGVLP